jgi:hypothetical protein
MFRRPLPWLTALTMGAVLLWGTAAQARQGGGEPKKPRPAAGAPLEDDDVLDTSDDDLIKKAVVQSATKSRTTIQEAPAVIHIVTSDDLERYGYRNLLQAM